MAAAGELDLAFFIGVSLIIRTCADDGVTTTRTNPIKKTAHTFNGVYNMGEKILPDIYYFRRSLIIPFDT